MELKELPPGVEVAVYSIAKLFTSRMVCRDKIAQWNCGASRLRREVIDKFLYTLDKKGQNSTVGISIYIYRDKARPCRKALRYAVKSNRRGGDASIPRKTIIV